MESHREEEQESFIEVYGANENNLKNMDVKIPRDKLVVITGLSGSGKSSLAFDTIYAEGQRRYIESFGSYARQFIGKMERPKVDKIEGLSPVISIEQKTVNRSPRSTVGTITEIYDYFRLLFARVGTAYSYVSGERMVKYSDQQILKIIFKKFNQKKILVLAPLVQGRKGHYRELFEKTRKQGFLRVRVDGELYDLYDSIELDRYKIHDIELVIDRIEVNNQSEKRVRESVASAFKHSKGVLMIADTSSGEVHYYSRALMCPTSGISYSEPAPNMFSFNSPYGACIKCNGLGEIHEINLDKIFPDKELSIKKGGIAPLGEYKNTWIFNQLETLGKKYDFELTDKIKDLSEETISLILQGTKESFSIESKTLGINKKYNINFDGLIHIISINGNEREGKSMQRWAQSFMNKVECPECGGSRLLKKSSYFKIGEYNISDIAKMDIADLSDWIIKIESLLTERELLIGTEIIKEVKQRVSFLLDVGLDYLSLNRSSRSLSGGEAQRIRLATQIGSKLVGVQYILDEPSIGLHQRDNYRLINSLKDLRNIGNSVIVVEHDKEMIQNADYVIDIGPRAGIHGGYLTAAGTPEELQKSDSLTGQYLNGNLMIEVPKTRRKGSGKKLVLKGAKGNNLQSIDVEFPLNKFICVTGVSGSGKSSLINGTLYPILNQHIYRSVKRPFPYTKIEGLKLIDKVIEIDQSPIGRTPRSNPSTYTGLFSDVRALFANLPEAKIRGYKPGRFSFNVKGGRCETCRGAGLKTIEMNFLPDVYVECEDCQGKRYNRETLEVRYKGKSIKDVLDLSVDQAVGFFEKIPSIAIKIKTLQDVGLGYITLGQSTTTLSGGEAQRVKLATELAKKDTGNTFYILDEPTTGLHFEDIKQLLEVLNRLVDNGNTVLIIEHNMDIIKVSDYVIDLGPEGGKGGGQVVSTGTPEQICNNSRSYTGRYLKQVLQN